jgi:hypothetical protein
MMMGAVMGVKLTSRILTPLLLDSMHCGILSTAGALRPPEMDNGHCQGDKGQHKEEDWQEC